MSHKLSKIYRVTVAFQSSYDNRNCCSKKAEELFNETLQIALYIKEECGYRIR